MAYQRTGIGRLLELSTELSEALPGHRTTAKAKQPDQEDASAAEAEPEQAKKPEQAFGPLRALGLELTR